MSLFLKSKIEGHIMEKKLWYWINYVTIVAAIILVGCSPTGIPTPMSPLSPPDVAISPLASSTQETPTEVWPEGKVLYHADAAGPTLFQIYKVVNGGEPVRLSSEGNIDLGARWSQDDKMIVFASYVDVSRTNECIFTMMADGSGRTKLTVDQPRLNWRPSLSPDGKHVIFISNRDNNFEIYKADLDGSSLVNITNTSDANERDPDWSPDGHQIVFVSDRLGGNGLYVMDSDGNNSQQLLDGDWNCSYPAWSLDGSKIAFTARVEGIDHIYTINLDDSEVYKVTSRIPDNVMPAWVGSDQLLFSGNDGGDTWNLFLINIDGTGLLQLTDTPYSERYPQWRP